MVWKERDGLLGRGPALFVFGGKRVLQHLDDLGVQGPTRPGRHYLQFDAEAHWGPKREPFQFLVVHVRLQGVTVTQLCMSR